MKRALQLIDAGALGDDNVERLAERLGVGDRHLRRLFASHVGTSPLQVAQTRRAHFARQLIDETRAAAGGDRVRRRLRLGAPLQRGDAARVRRTPTELRARARGDAATTRR